jgi:hypothetical protein
MRDIEARLRELEAAVEKTEPKLVVLFGDDPVPERVTERTVVLHFEEEDRGL